MPATIRHWMMASPVTLAGMVTAMVTMPPTLVAKPWAPAIRTLFSITSWIARSTLPRCSRSCLSAACAAGASGPTPSIARLSASRTNPPVSPGASSCDPRGELSPDGLLQAHATDRTGARREIPRPSLRAGVGPETWSPGGWVVR